MLGNKTLFFVKLFVSKKYNILVPTAVLIGYRVITQLIHYTARALSCQK